MGTSQREFHRQWITQCEAARDIKSRFGLGSALEYLLGEKLLKFVDASAQRPEFKRELHHFLAEIKRVFSPGEIRPYANRLERRASLTRPQRLAMHTLSSIFLVRLVRGSSHQGRP
jgi:hypothetical protein